MLILTMKKKTKTKNIAPPGGINAKNLFEMCETDEGDFYVPVSLHRIKQFACRISQIE